MLELTDEPKVEWIESTLFRWTFATDNPDEQDRQFDYWKGWFGFDEGDEPETTEDRVWLVRRT